MTPLVGGLGFSGSTRSRPSFYLDIFGQMNLLFAKIIWPLSGFVLWSRFGNLAAGFMSAVHLNRRLFGLRRNFIGTQVAKFFSALWNYVIVLHKMRREVQHSDKSGGTHAKDSRGRLP